MQLDKIMQALSVSEKETALQGSFSHCPWPHAVAAWDKFPGASGNGHTEIQAWIGKT